MIFPEPDALSKSQTLLDLCDGKSRVQALGAYSRAVQNCMTTVQAHAVVQGLLPLLLTFISAVGEPAVRLEENSGSEVLLAIPPVRRAGR